jgi:hypothetical protein
MGLKQFLFPEPADQPKIYTVRTIEDLLACVAEYDKTGERFTWFGETELLIDMCRRIKKLEET